MKAPRKEKETAEQASWRVALSSEMSVHFTGNRETTIYIDGPAAEIPAIKNGKISGKSFIEPSRLGRVQALDALFMKSAPQQMQHHYYGEEPVSLIVFFGKRATAFDSDNALTTVRDWLEPRTKKVSGKWRGWGVGLIKSDKRVISFALKASDIGSESKTTIIHLAPYLGPVREASLDYVSKVTNGRISI